MLKLIADNLDVLEERCGISERRITEILIDTGRRPDEVCTLEWDCLERDPSGEPVLIYTDAKNNRPGRRLPIAEATAAVITAQKDWARERYPHTPPGDLALFPRDKGNKDGTKPIRADAYSNAHRIFADAIAHLLLDADGQQVNPALVVPYAYRHSYAQRHADAGIQPDVLRELMSHRSMRTTTGYYRITETRLRAAVDKVARHQFNAAGQRVFTSIAGLLADEHARMRVGQVAVPFGGLHRAVQRQGRRPRLPLQVHVPRLRALPQRPVLPARAEVLPPAAARRPGTPARRHRPPALGTRPRRPARRADHPGPGPDPPDRGRHGQPQRHRPGADPAGRDRDPHRPADRQPRHALHPARSRQQVTRR